MDPQEKVCEQCHQVKRTSGDVCPDDGGKLHAVADERALVGRVIDNKLTLTGVVGKGGMGVVYRARQHSMDREVAVKVLHPNFASDTESVRRFLHEARAATRLEHPNVITVFDFGRTDDGLLYIVMELLNGHSLGEEIERGPIAPARTVHILTQIADAVHHAHERGLVHRDLKPENVILVHGSALRGDFVKVLDFGIAMMRSYDGIERITRTGAVCGTPAYMSPEQVLGDEVDARSDVYSLGVIAYEMLSGMHPLPADTAMRQMLAHLEKPVPPIATVAPQLVLPLGLERAALHALEKKREQRTPSALAFANELVAALGGGAAVGPVLGVPVAGAVVSRPEIGSTSSERSNDRSERGFADTARATSIPRPRNIKRLLPYIAVLAVLVLAVVFLATRPDATGEVTDTRGHGDNVAVSPPPAPTNVVAAMPDVTVADAKVMVDATVAAPETTLDTTPAETIAPEPTTPEIVAALPVRIDVSSIPVGAVVLFDGSEIGVTPLEVALPTTGSATLVVKKAGHRSETRTLTATSTDLSLKLERLPRGPRGDAPPIVP